MIEKLGVEAGDKKCEVRCKICDRWEGVAAVARGHVPNLIKISSYENISKDDT